MQFLMVTRDGDGALARRMVEFEDRAALDAWLNDAPYVTGDVRRTIEVTPFRRAA